MKIFKNWPIHNLFGHPLMQICIWFKLPDLGNKIHDYTMPEENDGAIRD